MSIHTRQGNHGEEVVITTMTHDLVCALQGRPMHVGDLPDGRRVILRLSTPDEFRADVRVSHDAIRRSGGTPPQFPSDADVERLTRPLKG